MSRPDSGPARGDRVALIMPAHRLGPDLDASVASVKLLDPAPDEFVVVVDGSPDVACRLAADHNIVEIARSGPAAARNAGVQATTAEIVLFIDSDVVVPADLIALVTNAMADGSAGTHNNTRAVAYIDAIIGSYDASPTAASTVSQFRNLLHHWTHQQSAGRGHTFWGACGAVRRAAFEIVGGFDESYDDATIEDIELGERLTAAGFHIEVVPWVQVTHLKRWTLPTMVHTDIAKRGVPWSRLILRRGAIANDLNTTRAARISVAIAGMLVGAMIIAASAPVRRWQRRATAAAAVLGAFLTWRDRLFLLFLKQQRSTGFALRCVPLMWIHHVSAGVAFVWAVVTWPVVRQRLS